jgi:peptidyl-prolyl cis-trans isomerase B (cyclophilin B)
MNPNSAGSQFFIMVAKSPHLDSQYAAFGRVLSGMETADQIVSEKTGPQDRPVNEQRIKIMTVDTFGVEYGEVKKM